MSYILDALRRADAERDRGAVPSIHAQQLTLPSTDDEPRRRPQALLWVVAALSIALLAVLAWTFLGHDGARTSAAPPTPATPSPTGGDAVVVAPRPIGSTAEVVAVPTRPVPAPADEPARPVRKAVRKTAPPAATTAPGDDRAPAGPAAPPDARPPPANAETRVVAQRDLPEDIRRSLPNVIVGGSTYSTDKASRMLMINGQIFREGDAIAAGLTLQQIKPRSAVLAFKGYRYEIGF